MMGFVFFATICSYNFHYLMGGIFVEQKFSWSFLYSQYQRVLFMAVGGIGAWLFFSAVHVKPVNAAIAFLLTFLYSVPLIPLKQLDFTRRAGFVKTLLLSFTWMFVSAYMPLSRFNIQFTTGGWLMMTSRFLFMLMLCILFDNRDRLIDRKYGLHSLSTDLPPKLMRRLIYGLFALLFITNFLFNQHGITLLQTAALQLTGLITMAFYIFSNKKQGYYFYYFGVDGLMILSALLTTVVSI